MNLPQRAKEIHELWDVKQSVASEGNLEIRFKSALLIQTKMLVQKNLQVIFGIFWDSIKYNVFHYRDSDAFQNES